jgi:hypothetical protein
MPSMSGTISVVERLTELRRRVGWTCPGLENVRESVGGETVEEVADGRDDTPLHAVRSTAKTATHTRRHWFLRCDRLSALSGTDSREVPRCNSPTIPNRLTIVIFHAINDHGKSRRRVACSLSLGEILNNVLI